MDDLSPLTFSLIRSCEDIYVYVYVCVKEVDENTHTANMQAHPPLLASGCFSCRGRRGTV